MGSLNDFLVREQTNPMGYDLEYIALFQSKILEWFQENRRDFPWRRVDASNYELIISEVLLQRTKAEYVANFYPTFMAKYPDWETLGAATEASLIAILSAIGLQNQKGKQLYALAQEMKERKGILPTEKNVVMEMPLMGMYTANAFELLILKTPSPLLDVNMSRLLGRIFDKRGKVSLRHDRVLQELSGLVVDHDRSKEINWAILDYAALICKAHKPKCHDCIFREDCIYFLREIGEM